MIKTIQVSNEKPPQWILDAVKEKWGVEWESPVIFTYGDLITTFSGKMSEDLLAHEGHHTIQQKNFPDGKDGWWKRYLEDDEFRLEQELECYRKQYRWVVEHVPNKQERFRKLKFYAESLSSPMYGDFVGFNKAMQLIKDYE